MSLIDHATGSAADALAFGEAFNRAQVLGTYARALFSFYVHINKSVPVTPPPPPPVSYEDIEDCHFIARKTAAAFGNRRK